MGGSVDPPFLFAVEIIWEISQFEGAHMPSRNVRLIGVSGVCVALIAVSVWAQAPARGGAQGARGAAPAPARGGAAAPARAGGAGGRVQANLAQLMRGIIYPASNVVFASQGTDPATVKAAQDPSTATDPLMSTYGQWQAVENAALALSESANLLMIPGRRCMNGKPVPMQNPDWPKFVEQLRAAGMTAYKAAQSKNQDAMLDAADAVVTACGNCHDKWREKADLADRCT
jgi:hypothetical protein